MRSLKRLMCAALAVLIVTCGMLAQGSAENNEQAVIEAEEESREAAEKEKAEKEAAEKEAAEKEAAEKEAAEKEAAEKEAAEKEAAEKEAAEKEAAEKEAAEKEPTEEEPTEEEPAEEEPTEELTQEPTGEPADEPPSEPTEAPTQAPTEAPTQGPTEAPTQAPTEAPTSKPTVEPTQTPTEAPTQAPTVEPTQAPTVEPTQSPTPEPTVEPTQLTLALVKTEGMTVQDGVYHMFAGRPASMMFAWNYAGECTGYHISLSGSQYELLSSGSLSETEYTLDLSALQSGQYVFLVEAMNDDEPVASARFPFELSLDGGGPRGGPPGGGFPGGGGSRGGAPGGASDMEQEQGFHITPGTALTSSHTSGTKDMLLYGTVALTVSEEEMTELVVGDVSLGATLDGGAESFAAAIDGSTLTLTSESGSVWTLNGRAIQVLSDSGIDTLMLSIDGREFALATDLSLTGGVYARLRAEGLVASDYEYRITDEGVFVWVAGELYRLDEAGTLTPMEGD